MGSQRALEREQGARAIPGAHPDFLRFASFL